MNPKKIVSVTCGILFKKSFGIMDSRGSIVDDILHSKNYYSPIYFPSITTYTYQTELSNPKFGHSLILSSDNLIYKHVISEDFEQEYKMFTERVIILSLGLSANTAWNLYGLGLSILMN